MSEHLGATTNPYIGMKEDTLLKHIQDIASVVVDSKDFSVDLYDIFGLPRISSDDAIKLQQYEELLKTNISKGDKPKNVQTFSSVTEEKLFNMQISSIAADIGNINKDISLSEIVEDKDISPLSKLASLSAIKSILGTVNDVHGKEIESLKKLIPENKSISTFSEGSGLVPPTGDNVEFNSGLMKIVSDANLGGNKK